MYNYPSRSEKRQSKLYEKAEKGYFTYENAVLYKSEIKNLRKQGFEILDIKVFSSNNALYSATISWEHAFGKAIPPLVYSYIHRVIEFFPTSYTKDSFAKELFVIAKRTQLYNSL